MNDSRKVAVYDIESNRWVHFVMLGFFDGQVYKTFDSIKKFIQYIDNKRYNGWTFYAHNGGRFDFLFLVELLIKAYGANFNSLYNKTAGVRLLERGGSVISAFVRTGIASYTLSDSYARLPQSLAKLGKAFNTAHQKLEHDHHVEFDKTNPEHLRYLENDCRCLYEVLEAFDESEYVVEPKLTIASQAVNTWQKKFLGNHDLRMQPVKYDEIFRGRHYAGGRVEVYRGYAKNVHCFDVNSLYPWAMKNDMPEGECFETSTEKKDCIGFYEVEIKNTPNWFISPLLHQKQKGTVKENYYVKGSGIYYLSTATLDYLRHVQGVTCRVRNGLYFKRRGRPFDGYVDTFYRLKARAKGTGEYLIAKLMLNSLYGKLGQSSWKEQIQTYSDRIEYSMKDYSWFSEELGLVLTMEESHSKFILPYLAGYITELARLRHYELLSLSGEHALYCDTDSILTEKKSDLQPFVGKKLGQLTYEGHYQEGVFIAPKTYALKDGKDEKVRFKGFSADQFHFSDMVSAAREGTTLSENRERILSLRECVQLGRVKKSKRKIVEDGGTFLKLCKTTKRVKAIYDKRLTIPDSSCIFRTEAFSQSDLT